jgi:hypothetical protein
MPEVPITRPAAPRVEDYSVVSGSLGQPSVARVCLRRENDAPAAINRFV